MPCFLIINNVLCVYISIVPTRFFRLIDFLSNDESSASYITSDLLERNSLQIAFSFFWQSRMFWRMAIFRNVIEMWIMYLAEYKQLKMSCSHAIHRIFRKH